MLRLLLASACLLLTVPAVAADPAPTVCESEPCVEEHATAGAGGADASVIVRHLGGGSGVFVHVGTDGSVDVTTAMGISRCSTGITAAGEIYVLRCVF